MPFGIGRHQQYSNRDPKPGDEGYAPGWDALDARFRVAFPGQEPNHWKPSGVPLPAQDGLWGLSAYRDPTDWFYVTYGLSDLFDLFRPPDPSEVQPNAVRWSGFGLELTMRVRSNDPEPPIWPVSLLEKLGRYVYQTKAGFEHGHRLDLRGPITGGNPPTRLSALAFADDPLFQPIDTPLGRVDFVTAVGITAEELAAMKSTTTDAVLDDLRRLSPELVTDLSR